MPLRIRPFINLTTYSFIFFAVAFSALWGEWRPPEIRLPSPLKHPVLAFTEVEWARLQKARQGSDLDNKAVFVFLTNAESLLSNTLEFPPRGGAHNQFYQCRKHQIGLQTVGPNHHRCPIDGEIFSGEPYDDVLFTGTHIRNLKALATCARAYALTGEKKYCDHAIAILLGYADRYLSYPYHDAHRKQGVHGGHIFDQTLDEAAWASSEIAPAFDILWDALGEGNRKKVQEKLLRPLVENLTKSTWGINNHQTFHNAALFALGICLEDPKLLEIALNDVSNGFYFQLGASVSPDGVWYEGSWAYHFYTISAFVTTAEAARRIGMDLWSHPVLKKMFFIPLDFAMPDGSLPRFGDDVKTTLQNYPLSLEAAYHAYRDPRFLPLLPKTNNWTTILYGRGAPAGAEVSISPSKVFPDSGNAVLRGGGAKGLTVAFGFGPYGGYHGHFDKLSFVFFGLGKELAVDPGRAKSMAYELPIHRNWYKATLGHNTVVVNQKSQQPAKGDLVFFVAKDGLSAVEARSPEAYPGVSHNRLLLMTPDYLLVFDRLDSLNGTSKQFDWVYHNSGKDFSTSGLTGGAGFQDYPGTEYIQNVKKGTFQKGLSGVFSDEEQSTHLFLDGQAEMEVWSGDGPFSSVTERVPLVIARRQGPSAKFLALLEPVSKGNAPICEAVEWEKSGEGVVLQIKKKSGVDRVILEPGKFVLKRGEVTMLEASFTPPPAPVQVQAKKRIVLDNFETFESSSWFKRDNVSNFAIPESGEKDRGKALQFSGDFSKIAYTFVRKKVDGSSLKGKDIQALRFWTKSEKSRRLALIFSYSQNGKEIKFQYPASAPAGWKEMAIPLASFKNGSQPLDAEELAKMNYLSFYIYKSEGVEETPLLLDDISLE